MIKVIESNIFLKWFLWHFKIAPVKIIKIIGDYLRFSLDFFSIKLLLKTLFSPWKRVSQNYIPGLANLDQNIPIFILNTFSRSIAFIIRVVIIIGGIISTTLVFFLGVLSFLIWFLFPLFIMIGLFFSFNLII
jgi:hypothetical protein